MISGGPRTLSGRPTEVVASRLMGTDRVERALRNVRTREKTAIKGVENSFVSLVHYLEGISKEERREQKLDKTESKENMRAW